MDILTQGLLGAVLAQTAAKKDETKSATVVGFLSGLLADADVLIRSSNDTLLAIEYHRHFTHSVFFIPFGALLAAVLLWPIMKKQISFSRVYLFSLLGYSLSGFLDACTSYGTHLFWPLTEQRIAFHLISIVDPIFTLTLLVTCLYSIRKRQAFIARMGLSLAGLYLMIGLLQLQRAEAVIQTFASARGHELHQLVVKPTLGNLLLWRTIYQYEQRFYVDAVRVGLFSEPRVYQGDSIQAFNPETDLNMIQKTSVLYQDVIRFMSFSDNYVAVHKGQKNILADIRYSNYPTGLDPLWGIEIDNHQPEKHAKFSIYRNITRESRQRFYAMLLNDEVLK
ncbi:MAG: metal-dependent hydrolase [Gammaproteobacteria bacterium]|nr:metal-dependent hydrolase [Gammaproteobacteria bacterium]MDH5735193.1 metal-dependent hydrolase [Gammaproteobacteria bacterium]